MGDFWEAELQRVVIGGVVESRQHGEVGGCGTVDGVVQNGRFVFFAVVLMSWFRGDENCG